MTSREKAQKLFRCESIDDIVIDSREMSSTGISSITMPSSCMRWNCPEALYIYDIF